ncbi:MAG: Uma2 family endonuclease [Planctomycetaceae bacterium]|nr:Uma2 family endonuclease [Planctomycetales bacterium]MCB9920870.1 Uma2 family endonuclease [Planctomycetaceae bacterium]
MATSISNSSHNEFAFEGIPPLEAGDRLTRAEFERRWKVTPDLKRAELIEGVVYMADAVRYRKRGRPNRWITRLLVTYEGRTPGVAGADNTSVRMDLDNMPQPDTLLFIEPPHSKTVTISDDDYLEGAPELIVEIASSSASYDLGTKLNAYRRNGVPEYVVWRLLDAAFDWFILREGEYVRQSLDNDPIIRSTMFPGLWLDSNALLTGNLEHAFDTLARGLETPGHAAFVTQLRSSSA